MKLFVVKDDKIYLFKPTKNKYDIFYQETYDFDKATYYYKNSDDICDNFIVKVPVEGKDKIQIIYVSIQKSSGKIDGFTFLKNEHMGE